MRQELTKKQLFVLVAFGVLFLLFCMFLLVYFSRDTGKNQFGDRIRIQNYDSVVKNLSPEMRDSMENYLYTVVAMNYSGTISATSVNDVIIRDGSGQQSFSNDTETYDGSFIVDSKKIAQSYKVQYSYSKRKDNINVTSSPVVVSCLPKSELIYGSFDCKDLISESTTEDDALLQFLPFQNFSFKIVPAQEDDGSISLVVTLYISSVDLGSTNESRAQAVHSYKQQVYNWVASKGVDHTKYTYTFNYDDAGNRL